MMTGRKDVSPKIDGAIAKAVNFETSLADMARRSERRAWCVAFAAILMALILAGGYFYMLPLKEKVPFLVMADAYTGVSTVATLREDFAHNSITASEAINKSNAAHFVVARESFDAALINLRDWTTVYTMSSPEIAKVYTNQNSFSNPESPFGLYGKTKAIRVRILSIVLIGGDGGTTPKGATVRFQRSLYDKTSGGSVPLDSKLATLTFIYKSNLKMEEKQRYENPLGFQVTEYRVDNDYAASPPLEREEPAVTAGSAPALPDAALPAAGPGTQDDEAAQSTAADNNGAGTP